MLQNWKTYKLGDLIISANTGLDAIKRAPIVEEDTGVKCLRIQDVSQSKDFTNWGFCSVTEENYKKFSLNKGEIIIARTGNTIGVNMFINENIKAVFNNGLIRIRTNEEICDPKYVFYNFRSKKFTDYIQSIAFGTSTQPNMQIGSLLNFDFLIPPLPEQRAIASILSALDDKIELNLQMNKTLEEMAMALYKHWFVDFGPFKDGEFVESDLGMIPKGWEVKKLGEVFDTTSGGTPNRSKEEFYSFGNIPWVKSKELYGDFVIETEEKITELGLKKSSAKLLQKGSVLLAMYGNTVGVSSILSIDATCNQAICALSKKNLSNIYLYLFLKINKTEILNLAVGSAQQNISQQIIKQIAILVPPYNLPCFDKIELFYKKIEQNLIENSVLKEKRDSLLPKLISGEISIKI